MEKRILVSLVLCFVGTAFAVPFHSDPTVSGNVRIALKYIGKLPEVQLKDLEDEEWEGGLKVQMFMDALIRRQGAETPLRYPMPQFKNSTIRDGVHKKNPNPDLFPKFEAKKLSEGLRSLMGLKEDQLLTPIQLSQAIENAQKTGPIAGDQLKELRDQLGYYAIRCYNVLGKKTGHCHGPARPLPEEENH